MTFAQTVVLTDRIEALAHFYEDLLQAEPTWYSDHYAEFDLDGGGLALFTVEGHDEHIQPGAAAAGENRSVKLEFEVGDVDEAYERLQSDDRAYDWVLAPPEPMPWGTRIVVLRDPDGTLIEVFEMDASA
jgi:catechol 2,3-dioxygenase-like lactoylglutathione lyase family enzyme